jgi:hypothetical protein
VRASSEVHAIYIRMHRVSRRVPSCTDEAYTTPKHACLQIFNMHVYKEL